MSLVSHPICVSFLSEKEKKREEKEEYLSRVLCTFNNAVDTAAAVAL